MFQIFRNLLVCLFFICFSPRQRMYMTMYTNQTHAFHLSPKVWFNYFLKKLPVPKNNRAAPWLVSRMQPLDMLASCLTSLTAYEGKCLCLGLLQSTEHSLLFLVRFFFDRTLGCLVLRWELATKCVSYFYTANCQSHQACIKAWYSLFWNCFSLILSCV